MTVVLINSSTLSTKRCIYEVALLLEDNEAQKAIRVSEVLVKRDCLESFQVCSSKKGVARSREPAASYTHAKKSRAIHGVMKEQ